MRGASEVRNHPRLPWLPGMVAPHAGGPAPWRDYNLEGSAPPASGAGAPDQVQSITILSSALAEAIMAEILDYFSPPSVSGVSLQPSEAQRIASAVIQRVCPDPSAAKAS
jgi:hypothetical protein